MRALAAVTALALALSACADSTNGATTSAPAVTTTTLAATTTSPPAATTTTTTTQPPTVGTPQTDDFTSSDYPGSGPVAFLTEVRTESYSTYTRIVFEFAGDAAPEFTIRQSDQPVLASPSGEPIDLEGSRALLVSLAPASGVDLSGDAPVIIYNGPDRIAIDASAVHEVVKTEDFEAHMSWAVGLDAVLPFSFTTLADPTRLVIDIHTEDSP